VDLNTVNHLIELNHQFYQTFAGAFSATRQRIQPGVRRQIEHIPAGARLLDLGCGNGELWRTLRRQKPGIDYTGLDFSAELLGVATASGETAGDPQTAMPGFTFVLADLSSPDWEQNIQAANGIQAAFDVILAYAVLHHLPGEALRSQVLHKVRHLLKPGGRFFHSEWQFLNSPRLSARIQGWQTVGLAETQVDPGDYLMDWRSGGYGLRYVHHFDEAELSRLAKESGFQVVETFYSDGESAKLGLYQVWQVQE
jgi:tRNA (uracil-5-)-methyltransferase TRM9